MDQEINSSTPVVVFKCPGYAGLGILRSLGRLGIPVYSMVDDVLDAPAFHSRYCAGKSRCSSHFTEKVIGELLDVGRRIGRRSVLIVTYDELAIFVAENADRLREQFIFPDQTAGLVRSLCSKREMHHKARAQGVPTAEIFFPRSREEVLDFLKRSSFPIVVKAIHGWLWRRPVGGRMAIANTERELLDIYDAMEPNVILQEYIPGGEDTNWIFTGYFNDRSDCLFGFTGKKIRQWPLRRGVTTLGVCLKNETVDQTTRRFMKDIRYRGIVDVDYRYDARDGKYKVLDVNPRMGANFRIFVTNNGMDVVRALYLDMTRQPIVPGIVCDGRKWIVEDYDFLSALTCMSKGDLTSERWSKSLRGVRETAYFAADDPLPFLHMSIRFCWRLVPRRGIGRLMEWGM